MVKLTKAVEVLGLATLAAGHGYVDTASIGGVEYKFYQVNCVPAEKPYQDPYLNPAPDRVSRPVAGDGPIEDVNSIDLQCGGWSAGGVVGSAPAKLHAAAEAGSTVKLRWTLWPDSHVGPMITYMARCPDTGCQDWEPAEEAVFFKIQEEGRESSTSNEWGSSPLMTEGYEYEYTVPACLQPGHYLVRHETIALHAAFAYPGVQFYPNCHQLEINGLGTAVPTDLVSFPGAYAADDPGVTFNAYLPGEYTIPGPAVFTC
ncbi:Esterase/lipase/thioesterase [Verticillium nonalfalfae]|uniref:lytic cellulose monooxygenase (C4-dehydrogenating) n=1 Tax=Verticillium nonalfalfae TaxID=1051616 RepID=A0A3M9YH41_9PEZI|nr:Esterase/lipase/thioesterase [Verticillium nonalfalfae]RNJ59877.1 Esterase/lipase/thioesterase [Verticillium nonalfalfae]